MTAVCPVCATESAERAADYRAAHDLFQGMGRYTCRTCEMVFAWPMPDDAMLAAYNGTYFQSAHGGMPADPVSRAFYSAINRLRVAHVEEYVDARRAAIQTVLEVGPGHGYFARHWLARHAGTAYYALESDGSCLPGLEALGIRLINLSASGEWGATVDLLVLSHVLEHTARPFEFLAALTARLRPGGVVFVEVPCRDWEHKPQDEPHLLFFDKRSLGHLFQRVGLTDTYLSYHGQEIARLRGHRFARRVADRLRTGLLVAGVVAPFARVEAGLEQVTDPLERAVVRPFGAHRERSEPAWWLRAVAVKP